MTVLEATVHLIDSPPLPHARRRGLRRRRDRGRPRAGGARAQADRARRRRRHADRGHDAARSCTATTLSQLPDGHGWLVIEVGGDTKDEADERGRAIIATLEKAGGGAHGHEALRRPDRRGSTSGRSARPASARRRSSPASPTRYEGWEDSAVPPERLGEYLRELRSSSPTATATRAPSTATTARAASTPAGTSTSRRVDGHRDLAPLPRRRRRPRPLARRLALGRARRRPVAGRAPAEDVRRRARRGVPRVQGDLGPRRAR